MRPAAGRGESWTRRLLAVASAVVLSVVLVPMTPVAARGPSIPPTPPAHPTRCGGDTLGHGIVDSTGRCVLVTSATGAAVEAAGTVGAGFQESVVFSGLTKPSNVRFSPDGRVFVAQKDGRIYVYPSLTSTTPTLFADLRSQVDDYWDRGLLGIALDPAFPTQPYVYALYTFDAPIGGAAPVWNDACPTPPGPTTDGCVVSGRLVRLTAAGNVATGPEQVLINDWCQQYPSHSIGDIRFGPDGALYVSSGDGANFNAVDYGQGGGSIAGTPTPVNPCGDPPTSVGVTQSPPTAEGGALRSQSLRRGTDPVAGTYASVVTGLSPVGYWRLGETSGTSAVDATGVNPGTYLGSPTLGATGLLTGDANKAVGFDGVNDQVTVPSSTSLNQSSQLSIAAWINVTSWGTGNRRIVQKGISDSQYRLLSEYGGLSFDLAGVGLARVFGLPTEGQRHFVVGTYDGATMRLYVDDVLVASTAATGSIAVTADPLALGNKPSFSNGSDMFQGTLDDVSIHRVGLTAAQVHSLWVAGTGTGTAQPVVLNGAILRLDPATGAALPDNPLAGSADANARRIVASGLRNPFRFTFRPGTSETWIGDVGWGTWEEIDRAVSPTDASVENFGWPCYEGSAPQPSYQALNLAICTGLYGQAGAHATPYYAYRHDASVVAGESCPTANGSSISGLAFYTGGTYPAAYQGALLFSDYTRKCIWAMMPGANGLPDPANIQPFVTGAAGPVEIEIGPGGDLFYVDYDTGTIRRIQYLAGGNNPPTAVIAATPTSGPPPLAVAFDGRGSSDPDAGDTISYSWDLNGDGTYGDSTSATPSFTYTTAGSYTARLQVTDSHGASATTSTVISVATSAPVPVIDTPASTLTYAVGDAISFSGHATDPQDGALPASALSWQLAIEHCPSSCHTHTVQSWSGVATGSFNAPDHDYPSSLILSLTATDAAGLTATTTVRLSPRTVVLTFRSNPTGLELVVGQTPSVTPFTRTVIVNSANAVFATSPQTIGGRTTTFVSWSDGQPQGHSITAPPTATTYTATFTNADLSITKTGTINADRKSITYTLTVRNAGPSTAKSTVASDVLISKLGFTSATPTQGSCAYASATRKVTCALGDIVSGQTVTIRLVVTAALGPQLDNTATVTSSTPDPASGNDSSSFRIRVK